MRLLALYLLLTPPASPAASQAPVFLKFFRWNEGYRAENVVAHEMKASAADWKKISHADAAEAPVQAKGKLFAGCYLVEKSEGRDGRALASEAPAERYKVCFRK